MVRQYLACCMGSRCHRMRACPQLAADVGDAISFGRCGERYVRVDASSALALVSTQGTGTRELPVLHCNSYFLDCFRAALRMAVGRWNWRVMLAVEGAFPLLWVLVWVLCIYDYPRQAPWISAEERQHLEEELRRERRGAGARRSRIFSTRLVRPAGAFADCDQAADVERSIGIFVLASERDRKSENHESLHRVTSLYDSIYRGRGLLGAHFAQLG